MNRLETLLKLLENEPHDAFTRYAVALEYMGEGRVSEAGKELSAIISSNPDYLAAYYQYGKVLEEQGDIETAEEIYRSGLALAEKQNDLHTRSELQEALDNLY
jgi:Tfp pilus assembly protein PilF